MMLGFTETRLPGVRLFGGDSEKVLPFLLKDDVDAIITDPPAGISFMGKEWDSDKGGRDQWIRWLTRMAREMLRTLKPGGHALVWALPRTSHWTATALEDAGFEIRDVIMHVYGSGFPKSHDVAKAVDEELGDTDWKATRPNPAARPGNGKDATTSTGWDKPQRPPKPVYETDQAKSLDGFGTALKPAAEHWILARKPLVFAHTTIKGKRRRDGQTVAETALKHGTGGLNIGAARVGTEKRFSAPATAGKDTFNCSFDADYAGKEVAGRWPANFALSHNADCEEMGTKKVKGSNFGGHPFRCTDGCAVAELDRQSGSLRARGNKTAKDHGANYNATSYAFGGKEIGFAGDAGGASRFFYCAKASRREKGEDNTHPTVKPTALMTYLIKLITPPGGTVLDPFMGSGTTGVAAVAEGFKFIGIERDPQYLSIAARRIAHAKENVNDQARSAAAAHHK
jgi:site-specific DNA-methyltransferase (adenine-specific)